ncbi:hypothetical protein BDZ45DRAFT_16885 [Acephala macrosclerotiorum]|nr:hypothetical protein BDZ45DRAFT_16885 [Acephala macrosclerotiorum]
MLLASDVSPLENIHLQPQIGLSSLKYSNPKVLRKKRGSPRLEIPMSSPLISTCYCKAWPLCLGPPSSKVPRFVTACQPPPSNIIWPEESTRAASMLGSLHIFAVGSLIKKVPSFLEHPSCHIRYTHVQYLFRNFLARWAEDGIRETSSHKSSDRSDKRAAVSAHAHHDKHKQLDSSLSGPLLATRHLVTPTGKSRDSTEVTTAYQNGFVFVLPLKRPSPVSNDAPVRSRITKCAKLIRKKRHRNNVVLPSNQHHQGRLPSRWEVTHLPYSAAGRLMATL